MINKQAQYALLSANSYFDVRGGVVDVVEGQLEDDTSNLSPIPPGWELIEGLEVSGSGKNNDQPYAGFSARTYRNTSTEEICISYAGTEFKSAALLNEFMGANVPLALGVPARQLEEAADFFVRVRKQVGATANITFTGHSLGGVLSGLSH